MAKTRVYELSKEYGMENKDMLEILEKNHIEAKNHMSSLSDMDVEKIRGVMNTKNNMDNKTTEIKEKVPAPAKAESAVKPESEQASAETKSAEEQPKKKKLIRVVRPQNSRQGLPNQPRHANGRPGQGNGANRSGQNMNGNRAPQRNSMNTEGRTGAPQQNRPVQQNRPQPKPVVEEPAKETRKPVHHVAGGNLGIKTVEPWKPAEIKIERPAPQPVKETASSDKTESAKRDDRHRDDNRRGETRGESRGENRGEGRGNRDGAYRGNSRRPENAGRDNERQDRAPRGDRSERGDNRGDRNNDRFGERRNNNDRTGSRPDNRGNDNRGERRSGAPAAADIPADKNTGRGRREDKPDRKFSADNKNSNNSGKDNYKKRKGRKDQVIYDTDDNRKNNSKKAGAFIKPTKVDKPKEEEVIKMITVPETISIQELADKMKIQPSAIVKKLFFQGTIVTINQEIEYAQAEEIALEYDILCEPEKVVDIVEEMLREEDEDEETMEKRPPVVCVMGHVDHGKTSILDAVRNTNVIDREAGGITQHIGASVVTINGQTITFLDTPGHEAFTSMRMRGASSTDIAILVVAADDGVMPQTIEAINHAKAAGVEIIVAVNKIDKPGANVDKVKQEMTEYGLIAEDWGGSTVFVPVSAKTREGIDTLLEMVLLTAEVMELKANRNRNARGLVLEAQLDKGKGPVATVLVQKGTLKVGDSIAAGAAYGKVRAMMDDKGRRVKVAYPSTPVEILGLSDVPGAGDVFVAPGTDKEARNLAEAFVAQSKVNMLNENKSRVKMSLEDLYAQIQEGNLKELDLIVKADVQGSVEAVRQSLEKLSNNEVVVKVIHGAVGAINESDVTLASASNAIIIGFNVRPDGMAKESAEREGVDIRLYRVIYNAIEDIEAAMKGMLDPEFKEEVIGHAEVRQTFHASGVGTIAGCYVTDGRIERNISVRLNRDNIVVYEGVMTSLKRFKDDMKEVKAGYECGITLENYNDIKEGDVIEAFKMVEVPR